MVEDMAPQRRVRQRQTGPEFTTTVTIPRALYDRVRIAAIRQHRTFRAFFEQALRDALARPNKEETR